MTKEELEEKVIKLEERLNAILKNNDTEIHITGDIHCKNVWIPERKMNMWTGEIIE